MVYEVSPASAYTPRTWTRPLPPADRSNPFVDRPQYSPCASPTRSPADRKPLSPTRTGPLLPAPPQHRFSFPQTSVGQDQVNTSPESSKRNSTQRVPVGRPKAARYSRTSGGAGIGAAMAEASNRGGDIHGHGRPQWDPVAPREYILPVPPPWQGTSHVYHDSQDSVAPLNPAASPTISPRRSSVSPVDYQDFSRDHFPPDNYVAPSPPRNTRQPAGYDEVDPSNIADDDDPFKSRDVNRHPGLATAAGSAGIFKALGARRDASGTYDGLPHDNRGDEKSQWLEHDNRERTRRMRIIWIVVAVVAVLAIIGGVVGGVLGSRKSHSSSSALSNPSSSSSDSGSDNGLTIDSAAVQALMNNTNLHRVFPAIDYTPMNTQYPACLTLAPSQDNVTLDLAMLSQLTPTVRLYGTDCNQTEMVLTAIERLGMNDSMTVWLGVWLGDNSTTNERQLAQMYDIVDKYPASHFKGVIVGNEVLFTESVTLEELSNNITSVKSNLTDLGINLPVATSDLGSDWTESLADISDVVMANVHPFFAGVTAEEAASWTWSYWQTTDVDVSGESGTATVNGTSRNIISETGWPSQGGNDCGTGNTCQSTTDGSVAGIDELNTFMEGWVCQALDNGTEYFWFEAFDEPWKIMYDTGSDGWEDHWGLMDVDRNLKDGLKIPSCDKTL